MFALALLWMRRSRLGGAAPRPSAWGWAPIIAGAASQLAGGYFHQQWFDGLALLPYLAGLALLFGGWRYLGWAWPPIAFLAFMVPLPWRIETALGPPLQSLATAVSAFLLQDLGFMAFAEGNAIQLDEARVNVAEACSGLSMLITFIAVSTAAALVVRRPLVDRFVLVISAIPVALLANIARISVTGILYETVGGEIPSTFYHDLAGWLMIPLALVLYWLEIAILSRLRIETRRAVPSVFELVEAQRPAVATPTAGQRYKPSIP
jgi:exosortase